MEQTPSPLPDPPTSPPMVPAIKNFWTTRKLILISVGLSVILIMFILALLFPQFLNKKDSKPAQKISTEVSNSPLYEFSGFIEKINGNTLEVSKIVMSPAEKKLTYRITVSGQTKFTAVQPEVPYALKSSTESATVLDSKLSDLKVGQYITIVSKEDINALGSNTFEAQSITISPGVTNFIGTIQSVTGNVITVKAGPPSVSEAKDYQISFDNKTEIVDSNIMTNSDHPTKKVQLPISSLSPNTQVLIYTDSDVNKNTKLKALKIDIIKNL